LDIFWLTICYIRFGGFRAHTTDMVSWKESNSSTFNPLIHPKRSNYSTFTVVGFFFYYCINVYITFVFAYLKLIFRKYITKHLDLSIQANSLNLCLDLRNINSTYKSKRKYLVEYVKWHTKSLIRQTFYTSNNVVEAFCGLCRTTGLLGTNAHSAFHHMN